MTKSLITTTASLSSRNVSKRKDTKRIPISIGIKLQKKERANRVTTPIQMLTIIFPMISKKYKNSSTFERIMRESNFGNNELVSLSIYDSKVNVFKAITTN